MIRSFSSRFLPSTSSFSSILPTLSSTSTSLPLPTLFQSSALSSSSSAHSSLLPSPSHSFSHHSSPLSIFFSSPFSSSSSSSPRSRPSTTTSSSSSSPTPSSTVVGDTLSHSLDLSTATVGQHIDVPYEMTISSSHSTQWQSTFATHDRIFTSLPYAQSLNFPHNPLPFSLVLYHTISMAHVDESREVLDIGLNHATYVRPTYVGDTLKQSFTIHHLRNTSDNKGTIVTVGCELHNQRNQLVFSVEKIMLYPMITHPYKISKAPESPTDPHRSHLLSHILYHSDGLPRNAVLSMLRPRQLILHQTSRPIGKSANMALSTLYKWNHPTIYNMKRYKDEELVVTGGLILAASLSASSRGMFECLNETIDSVSFINKASPIDLIGAFTFIKNIKTLRDGFEEIECITMGVKNIDVPRELHGVEIPIELFVEKMRPTQLKEFIAAKVPILTDKILCVVERKVVRQSPYSQQRSIPLL